MTNIFAYGSLMYEPVWSNLTENIYRKENAILQGYHRYSVHGEEFPGIIECTDASVEGIVYFDVHPDDLEILDSFEGDYYCRTPEILFMDDGRIIEADIYVFKSEFSHLLSDDTWQVKHFETVGMKKFIDKHIDF